MLVLPLSIGLLPSGILWYTNVEMMVLDNPVYVVNMTGTSFNDPFTNRPSPRLCNLSSAPLLPGTLLASSLVSRLPA
ncbi:hypothetical protein DPMN_010955 [Dreissena polymorpha]|uniref:Uncharacterized protein n=1 Tax=Dreissena polymorpha TaxID=45954 RepID=A0A9D4MZN1_DREPO|nr:hypothetical protein DPMN_010955 [Dreissena polymorpha]